jgi:hypothetical protein
MRISAAFLALPRFPFRRWPRKVTFTAKAASKS